MADIALSSQESTAFFPLLPTSMRRGRPRKLRKFRGNQFTNREEASTFLEDPSDTLPPKPKRIQHTLPRHGYTSRHSAPFSFRKQETMFKISNKTVFKTASIPSGMRLLDVSILADAITKRNYDVLLVECILLFPSQNTVMVGTQPFTSSVTPATNLLLNFHLLNLWYQISINL